MMKKILLIEDDLDYGEVLKTVLEQASYTVDYARTSVEALKLLDDKTYDLVLSDLGLDKFSGLQILDLIRIRHLPVKFIIITGSISDEDELRGLQYKIDDYIKKASSFQIILQRIANVFERNTYTSVNNEQLISLSESLVVDTDTHDVYKYQKRVYLSNLEYALLIYFLENKNQIFSREDLLEAVWGHNDAFDLVDGRTVDKHIRKIRQKLSLQSIYSIRGIGYRWYEK